MNNLFNSDSEYAILSILLNRPESFYELNGLKSFMFSSSPTEFLFGIITELIKRGSTPESGLIIETLKQNQKLDACGGENFITYVKSLAYDPNNIKEFEKIVINSYRARVLVETSTKLAGAIKSGDDINNVLSSLRVTVDRLGETSVGEETVKIADLLPQSVSTIQSRIGLDKLPGVSTGYSAIDDNTGGIGPGDLWILGGRPGSGKSALACNLALNMASQGNGVMIFSLEMPKQTLIERLLAIKSGVSILKIRLGLLKPEESKKITSAMDEIMQYPIYIDTNYSADLDYTIGTIKKYKKNWDIKVAILDYVQLMANRTEGMRFEIGQICRGFKLLGNDLGIGSILLSQLNRAVELRDDKRPILSDLKESGDLEQDTDLAGMLFREDYYDKDSKNKGLLEFIIRKQRNGPTGTVVLKFTDDSNRIEDL